MVFSPIFISTTTTTEKPIHAAWLIGCSTSCGGVAASSSDIGDNSGGCASGGCASGENGTDSGGGDADGGGGGDDGGGCGGGCGGN